MPLITTFTFSLILILFHFQSFSQKVVVNDTVFSSGVLGNSCNSASPSHRFEVRDEALNLPDGLSLELYINKIESASELLIDGNVIEENSILPFNENQMAYDLFLQMGGTIHFGLRIVGTLEEGEKYPCEIQYSPTLGECGNVSYFDYWLEDSCIAEPGVISGLNGQDVKVELFYPNPVTQSANIQFNKALRNATISVYNSENKVVLSKQGLNGNSIEVDFTSLPAGIYFYVVSHEGIIIDKNKFQIHP